MTISGSATAQGTQRYRDRHLSTCVPQHFQTVGQWAVSSIGLGTYLGQPNNETDILVTNAAIECVKQGVNLLDTAINYRNQRAELSLGTAIRQLVDAKLITREEIVVCTKGGFIPHPDRVSWFRQHYINDSHRGLSISDLVAQCHCMHPVYLESQLAQSLTNLGLETIDVYYIHNPETQLTEVSPSVFYDRLKAAFERLEQAVEAGKIRTYGLATWNAFRVPPSAKDHIDMAKVKAIAQAVGGETNHLQFIQLPLNLAMPEAIVSATQVVEGERLPAIEAAQRLGMTVIASASIAQANVVGRIPLTIAVAFQNRLTTDGRRALQFTRSTPGLLSALVGMKSPAHVTENLTLGKIQPMDERAWRSVLDALNQGAGSEHTG